MSENRSDPAARRPLRIGDVFEVTATDVTDLTTWTAVHDHTQENRAEGRAALDAMATPLRARWRRSGGVVGYW